MAGYHLPPLLGSPPGSSIPTAEKAAHGPSRSPGPCPGGWGKGELKRGFLPDYGSPVPSPPSGSPLSPQPHHVATGSKWRFPSLPCWHRGSSQHITPPCLPLQRMDFFPRESIYLEKVDLALGCSQPKRATSAESRAGGGTASRPGRETGVGLWF